MFKNLSFGCFVGLISQITLGQGHVTEWGSEFIGTKVRQLGLAQGTSWTLSESVEDWAIDRFQSLNSLSGLNLIWNSSPEKSVQESFQRSEAYFYLEDHKICGFSLTLSRLNDRNLSRSMSPQGLTPTSLVLGSFPIIDPATKIIGRFPLRKAALRSLSEAFLKRFTGQKADEFKSLEECLFQKNDGLYPAREVLVRAGGETYRLWMSEDEVFRLEKTSFAAEVQAYVKNASDQDLKTYSIPTKEDGFLGNDKFQIDTHGIKKAYEPSNEFIYDPSDNRFKEASVFVHVNNAMDYFHQLGFKSLSKKKITIHINVLVNGSKNNAIYDPGSFFEKDSPTISIGTGDGVHLRNLTTDGDVVSHELAHHMIYQSLTSTVGESLVLHEGLADFFAFAKSKDSCLGESICPENSPTCRTYKTCLRSAKNDLVYKSEPYLQLTPHQQGQLVSGLLWDLFLKNNQNLDELAETTLQAVRYLNPSSDIQDFLSAFALADQSINQGRNICDFMDLGQKRGLGLFLDHANCKDILTWPKIDGSSNDLKDLNKSKQYSSPDPLPSLEPTLEEKTSKKKYGYCSLAGGTSELPQLCWILLVPMWIGVLRRRTH